MNLSDNLKNGADQIPNGRRSNKKTSFPCKQVYHVSANDSWILFQCSETGTHTVLTFLLSPARSGMGILVAPEFCPAAGVRRPVFLWAQKLKNYWLIFLKFYHDIPINVGMCNWFFKDATKNQNGRQRSTSKKNLGAKALKLKFSNFTITFPIIWRGAGDIFKVLLKFKMGATDQLQFFVGRKNSKK